MPTYQRAAFPVPSAGTDFFLFRHDESDNHVHLRNGNVHVHSCLTKQDAMEACINLRYTATQTQLLHWKEFISHV
jgi:hypothetical protein